MELEDVAADGRIFRRRILGARFGFVVACVAVAVAAAAVAEVPPSTPAEVTSLSDGGDCSGELIAFDDTVWCKPLSL